MFINPILPSLDYYNLEMVNLLNRKNVGMENIAISANIARLNEHKDVVFLESIGNFTRKYCCNGREFLVENPLHQLESMLPDEKFFKINDTFIVNADYIKKIKLREYVLLHKGIELKIAKDKYWDFIRFLKVKYNIW